MDPFRCLPYQSRRLSSILQHERGGWNAEATPLLCVTALSSTQFVRDKLVAARTMSDGQGHSYTATGNGADADVDADAGTNGTSQIDMRRPKPILSRRSSRRQFYAEARPYLPRPPHRPVQSSWPCRPPPMPPMHIGAAAADDSGRTFAADGSGTGNDAIAAATMTPKLILSPRRAPAAAAAVGFDTVGDGFVDALDTNRDGQVRCR